MPDRIPSSAGVTSPPLRKRMLQCLVALCHSFRVQNTPRAFFFFAGDSPFENVILTFLIDEPETQKPQLFFPLGL